MFMKDNLKNETVLFGNRVIPRFVENKKVDVQNEEPLVLMKKFAEKKILPVSEASRELFRARGAWPFDFFPDELVIEEKRIIVKRNMFPFFSTVSTIPINNLLIFELTNSIFFSSVFIKGAYGDNLATTFCWLTHKDAQKAKEIVDGLRLKESESLEVMEDNKKRLIMALQILGHA